MNDLVQETDVMRHYLKCELGKSLRDWQQSEDFVRSFNETIERLCDDDTNRLALMLSRDYRRNPLANRWGKHLNWRINVVPSSQLLMSEINQKVRPTLLSCGYRLAEFVQHMRGKGAADSNLAEFRDDSRRIWYRQIIGEQAGNMTQILDGSHRAVILALRGDSELSCYVATGRVP